MPSATFLLMIDALISGMLSTVPVTSRRAYNFLSAGAICAAALPRIGTKAAISSR